MIGRILVWALSVLPASVTPLTFAYGAERTARSDVGISNPLEVDGACEHVRTWLARPNVIVVHPGARHPDILFKLLETAGTGGNLTTDAHLAALAVEHQAELHSTDPDMVRFPGLRWVNPLLAATDVPPAVPATRR